MAGSRCKNERAGGSAMNESLMFGEVTDLPGYGPVKGRQLAGSLPVTADGGAYLYFWFCESQGDSQTDPIVLWLNGGPGSSSFLGFFAENGPYKINPDLSLTENPFSWNCNAGYLMIDQPAGSGLSFVVDPKRYARSESEATEQLYFGLQQFFNQWPEFRTRDFYVFGESYAGVYVPMIATRILDGNSSGDPEIRLKGIGVGDGWVDPYVQQETYADYAYSHGLVALADKREADSLYAACAKAIDESQPITSREADRICNKIELHIQDVTGGVNVYDVRMIGDYDFSEIGKYLDWPEVRKAIYVDGRVGKWADTSKRVAYLLEVGEQNSYAYLYPRLFGELNVLIYNGIYDMDCNFMGTDAWLSRLHWQERVAFISKPRTPWKVDGSVAGMIRSAGRLTQVLVYGAGHLVPMDQPKVALALLNDFVRGSLAMR